MKKLLGFLLAALLLTGCSGAPNVTKSEKTIVTSFYPIQIFCMNLLDGVSDVNLHCLAPVTAGCLHDYSLGTADYKTLENADALIINGAGMETFLPDVTKTYPKLTVVDSSKGISLIAEEHGESDFNSHIWLSCKNAMMQVTTISAELCKLLPEDADAISANCDRYVKSLTALDGEISAALAPHQGAQIVTFHEAFDYFAQDYGLSIAATITIEPDNPPSSGDIRDMVQTIRKNAVKAIFSEPQYSADTAESISRETSVPTYELDPIVSGEMTPSAYEDGMRKDLEVLKKALS